MNPDDLIKTVPALAKGATALGAAIPVTAITKRMLGPALDEVAEMWRDRVRLYRYERQLSCLKKAEKMAESAGFTPTAVPIKVLFPLLEGASFEEDEDIHSMWAALLANAANPEFCMKVRPGFVAALKQLSADEAALLNWFYMAVKGRQSANPGTSIELTFAEVVNGYKEVLQVSEPGSRFNICLSELEAAGLIGTLDHNINNEYRRRYVPTVRGEAFYDACCPPTT